MIGQEALLNKSLYERTLDDLRNKKALREEGKHIAIPFSFDRLSKVHPGITQGQYFCISANQKVGKSQLCDALFIYNPLNFVLTQKTNIKLKVFSFNLEMSKETKMRQVIAYRLFQKHKVVLSPRKLQSLYDDYILSDDILKFIEEDKEWFAAFEERITFIDEIRNATGIYKEMREYAYNNGKFFDKNNQIIPIDKIRANTEEVNKSISHYEQNDPNEFRIIVLDHISLLNPEKKDGVLMNLYDSIARFSSDYAIRLRNKFGFILAVVQQQSLQNESVDSLKVGRQEPSAANLSDYKGTAKDLNCLITLHSPFRAKQRTYMGYNIELLKDNFRWMSIDIDREGPSVETGLFFNGAVNLFKEMLPPDKMTQSVYDEIKKMQQM